MYEAVKTIGKELENNSDDFCCNDFDNEQKLEVRINLGGGYYGEIELNLDFKQNEFVVKCIIDERQYCNIFMVNDDDYGEDEDEDEDLDDDTRFDIEKALTDWNTTDIYSDLKAAMDRAEEITDVINSETGGCLNDEDFEFITRVKAAIK